MKPPIEPMLAELKDELPQGDFVYEPKLDGFRGVLFAGQKPTLWSRNRKDLGKRFPEILELRKSLPSCVLDGEIIAVRDGRIDFEALQSRLVGEGTRVDFVPFDLLELNGEDLRGKPWPIDARLLSRSRSHRFLRRMTYRRHTNGLRSWTGASRE